MSARIHYARLVEQRALATDVVEYRFALERDAPDGNDHADAAQPDAAQPGAPPPPAVTPVTLAAPLTWRAGQFISLTCGHASDGEPVLRSYSIANLPGHDRLVLLLKLVAGGAASEWFRALPVGGRVRFTGPMGFFVLDLAHVGDVVFGATGTGIAPLVPMIEELLARPAELSGTGRIHLFFGVRDEGDLFWQGDLAALVERSAGRLSVRTALSRPSPAWSGTRGRITPPIFELLPSLTRPTFYLCGNGAMIREVKAGLVERGVDRKRQIRTEAFFD